MLASHLVSQQAIPTKPEQTQQKQNTTHSPHCASTSEMLASHLTSQQAIPTNQTRTNTATKNSWPEPYIYGVYTVFLAGKLTHIRCIYGSG
jgi:hypothetical protein